MDTDSSHRYMAALWYHAHSSFPLKINEILISADEALKAARNALANNLQELHSSSQTQLYCQEKPLLNLNDFKALN